MAVDLDKLEKVLLRQFEEAAERQDSYVDYNDASSSYPENYAIKNRQAMAEIANALVNIERERREQRREKEEDAKLTLPKKQLAAGG